MALMAFRAPCLSAGLAIPTHRLHDRSPEVVAPLLPTGLMVTATTDRTLTRPDAFVLIDSGSAVTICPESHAPHVPVVQGECPSMEGAGLGQGIDAIGYKRVRYKTEHGIRLGMQYTVGSVRFPIAGVSKITADNGTIGFDRDSPYLMMPNGSTENLICMAGVY